MGQNQIKFPITIQIFHDDSHARLGMSGLITIAEHLRGAIDEGNDWHR